MITIMIYELAVITIFLAARALMPELFIGGARIKATLPVKRILRRRSTTPHFIHRLRSVDNAHSAGMGMMMH